MERHVYDAFDGISFCELFTECRHIITHADAAHMQFSSGAEKCSHYNTKTAELVWNMVGEAQVPTTAYGAM
jgi:hypothetical protein